MAILKKAELRGEKIARQLDKASKNSLKCRSWRNDVGSTTDRQSKELGKEHRPSLQRGTAPQGPQCAPPRFGSRHRMRHVGSGELERLITALAGGTGKTVGEFTVQLAKAEIDLLRIRKIKAAL
jgi:hypothetical protein